MANGKGVIPMTTILLLLAVLLTACTPVHLRDYVLVTEGPNFTIIQDKSNGKYLIYSDTSARAAAIANQQLECATKVCVIQPYGIITEVQRFNKGPRNDKQPQSH